MSSPKKSTIIISIISLMTPFIIFGMGYICKLKSENQALRINYLKSENIQLSDTTITILSKLDEIYLILNENNMATELLAEKVRRHEKTLERLETKIYGR